MTDYHTITNNDKSNRKGILRKAESDAIHSKYFDCSRCNENPLKCPMNTVLTSRLTFPVRFIRNSAKYANDNNNADYVENETDLSHIVFNDDNTGKH